MPQIQWIMARSFRQSCRSSGSFGPHVSLPWSIVKRMQATYTLPYILGERCLGVRAGKSSLNFPQATQHLVAMALYVTAPTGAQHITKVAGSGFHIKHCAVDIQFSHSLAINGPRLTLTPRADIVWVFNQSLSYATARLENLQLVL